MFAFLFVVVVLLPFVHNMTINMFITVYSSFCNVCSFSILNILQY